jgi:Trk-type K+ transport system membrane component
VAIVFMLFGALNFATHFLAWRRRSLFVYARDPEAYWFAVVIIASVVLVTQRRLAQPITPSGRCSCPFGCFSSARS